MPRHHLQPEALSTRIVQGHVLYSHVVVVEGRRTIFIAGQLARDRQGNVVGKGDMRAHIRQVGENLKAALAAAGAMLNDLGKTTTYVRTLTSWDCLTLQLFELTVFSLLPWGPSGARSTNHK
jgi:2-iminobutanoate/2-iminopropanoate deaminase